MTVPEGHFQLYAHLTPALPAGDYTIRTEQLLTATGPKGSLGAGQLGVAPLDTHLRITSPRFSLPPDQVLSTYPPAGSDGSYGSRLPQIVLKRRTLPWERTVDPENESDVDTIDTPWLALVVIAEGEAELVLNRPVAECVTPGQVLGGTPDVAQGNYLLVRRSVIDDVLPTQKDVPLLAHAREVDIHDTEMMMGDDDGFLSVVIGNRLPLPGRDASGNETPVKYLCALINLEGQFGVLRRETPPPLVLTAYPIVVPVSVTYTAAEADHAAMGSDESVERWNEHVERGRGKTGRNDLAEHRGSPSRDAPGTAASNAGDTRTVSIAQGIGVAKDTAVSSPELSTGWSTAAGVTSNEVYTAMAKDFAWLEPSISLFIDPEYRFPVLLHWSFTSTGDTTFRSLLEGLDSGLLGTSPSEPARSDGRRPLEVVETGHVGIDQRTRRGDSVRAWYRGPLLPHPADTDAPRLPLAHTADQLRAIVPDRREDLSLATAFEIGRLLALSQPSTVAALSRWRQAHYQTARRKAVWTDILAGVTIEGLAIDPHSALGLAFGRGLTRQIARTPHALLGDPLVRNTPGTSMGLGEHPEVTLRAGYAIDRELRGGMAELLDTLREAPIAQVDLANVAPQQVRELFATSLRADLTAHVGLLAFDALGVPAGLNPLLGGGDLGPIGPHGPLDMARVPKRTTTDALDDVIAAAHNDIHGDHTDREA